MSLLAPEAAQADEAKVPAAQAKGGSKRSEYQKKVRQQTRDYGKLVREYIAKQKNVPEDVKAAADWLGRDVTERAFAGRDTFRELFGADAKVGSKVTALDAFNKMQYGFRDMKEQQRKWAAKGIEIAFDVGTKTYTVTKLA